jgi:N-dimethylarginine dimethylaminohydrolase
MLGPGRESRVAMSTPAYYRDEAARCRELAAKSQDTDAIKRWLRMAAEYEQLAESMASAPHIIHGPPAVQRMPMQQQEIQQQQTKSRSDDEGDSGPRR